MRKSILALATLSVLHTTTASADTFFGLYAGAQAWTMDTEGQLVTNNVGQFDFDEKTQGSFYLALEHPVPLVPNVKVARSNFDTKGGTGLRSSMDLQSTDYILYYELFDNDVISFDFGLGARDIDGDVSVENTAVANSKVTRRVSELSPMAYARAEIGIPATNWGVYAQAYSQPFGDDTITDYEAALTYNLLDNLALDAQLQLGYRSFNLEVDELKSLYPDLEFKGAYLGLELHF